MLGQLHVVVAEEHDMGAGRGLTDEMHPFLDQGLTRLVCRMGLAGKDELHRVLRVGQQTKQPLRVVQQQVGPFVGRETPREAQCQRIGIKQVLRLTDRFGRRAGGRQLPGQPPASVSDKRLGAGGAQLPEPGVGKAANVMLQVFCRPQPAVFSTGFGPEVVGCGRVPAWHVNPVGHVPDGHFVRRPAGEQGLKEASADLPVQPAHAVHCPAPPDCQIGHVERLGRVSRVLAAQPE